MNSKIPQTLGEILKETAKQEIYNGEYKGEISLEEFDETPRFSGKTSMINGKINEKYNPKYEEENPGKSKYIIRDVTRHEINHHKYRNCRGYPRTLLEHVKLFYEPISDVLLPKGFSHEDIKYATNALEDTLLHFDLNKNESFALDGISYFLEEVGNSTNPEKLKVKKNINGEEREIEAKKKKFTKFYEAHSKLNMYLWGNKKQKNILQRFYTHDDKVKEVLENFLKKANISKSNLPDESSLKEISKIYAEEFSKLIEPNYAMSLFNHSGAGTKGREAEIPTGQESNEGNVFDKEMRTKDFKKSRVKEAYNSNLKVPKWINDFEAMDLLYESLAQKLEIKAKTYTEQNQMPVSWYGKRQFNPEKDNLKHTTFGFDENGEFGLRKKVFHEDVPIEVKTKPESFPRMRFGILDTSGSMKNDVYNGESIGGNKIIPWGDKSKYHYALLGWYGFLEYLKANHLLMQNSVDLANFSKKTILGKGLEEAKKIALYPQFHATNLDLNEIKHFFEGRDNLIFTISDGSIDNWDSIKDDFIKNAQKHQYFHLQIGQENSTTEDLRNAGLYVEPVMGDEDLARKTIDLTDRLLRKSGGLNLK